MSNTPLNIDAYQKKAPDQLGMTFTKRIVYLMDEQFRIPGTTFRFGLDPLMNLFPILGDMTGFLISGALLLTMAKKGAGNKLVVLMSINILVDALIGGIPVIGQIFDFYFKANSRNLKLMQAHYVEGKYQGSGKNTIMLAVSILLILLILIVFLLWKTAEWLAQYF